MNARARRRTRLARAAGHTRATHARSGRALWRLSRDLEGILPFLSRRAVRQWARWAEATRQALDFDARQAERLAALCARWDLR